MEKFLLDPKAQGAFTSEVMHKVVLNGIDFELPEHIWDAIDDAFGNYWNVEVGYGGWPDLNSAVSSISNWLQREHIVFPIDKVITIVNIIFDWIEQIPGATLDDSEVVIPHNYEEAERLRQEIKKQERHLKDLLPSMSGIPVSNFNDAMTNFVYISDKLKEFYPRTYSRLTKLFNEMEIEWGEVKGTKDIWIRDYMPIQKSDDRFIVYNYNPDYLKESGEEYLTDSHAIANGILNHCNKSHYDITLDGGNVVTCAGHLVLTDKVFQENGKPDFRKHVNMGEIPYNDLHLSHMAQELRYGFYGDVDWAILEVCDIEEVGNDYHVYLTAAGGISPTAARLAKHVILELNSFHNPNAKFIHDVYEPLDPPYRKAIPIEHVGDRIGVPYVSIPKEKVAGVVECNIPDEARAFKDSDPVTDKIGYLTAEFLVEEMHKGRIPKEFLPLQSGVGSTANAILGALGQDKHVPDFNIYTEVLQDSVVAMMLNGRVKDASACSLTVSNECLLQVYDNMDYFKDHLTLRQSEISNSPEIIRRLGVIAINTAIEADLYGNVNSTHISGVKMMNGIGGSGDFIRNAYLSIFTCPSVAKGGVISSIVPFVSHQDSSEHDVNIIVTEQGIADLRGKGPIQRAECIIENCAHPDYKQLLWDYLKIAKMGQTRHNLPAAFAMHDTLARKGDMKLTDFAEYVK